MIKYPRLMKIALLLGVFAMPISILYATYLAIVPDLTTTHILIEFIKLLGAQMVIVLCIFTLEFLT